MNNKAIQEMQKSVSLAVVVPVYNVEAYLEECLDSIIQQTEPFDEIIIVDDGSIDRSSEICCKYAESFPRIQLIKQENQGLGAARNTGLDRVKSTHVLFVDSDDWLNNTTVSVLKKELEEKNPDAIYFDLHCFADPLNPPERIEPYGENRTKSRMVTNLLTGKEYFDLLYPDEYYVCAYCNSYRTEMIRRIRFPEKGLFHEDMYTFFVYMIEASQVCYYPGRFYHRRYRQGSITTTKLSEKRMIDYCLICRMIYSYIDDRKDELLPDNKIRKLIGYYLWNPFALYKQFREETGRSIMVEKILLQILSSYKNFQSYLIESTIQYRSFEEISFEFNIADGLDEISGDLNISITEYKALLQRGIEAKYRSILLPLEMNNEKKRIAVYGIGRHTEGLINKYSDLCGKVKAEIDFFVTSLTLDAVFRNKKVRSISEISDNYDGVIVSSFIYRKEMLETLSKLSVDIPVIDFYQEYSKDLFSEYAG